MLHSEDADINKVLRQVIELDKRAERIKSDVMERAEEILEQTKKRIIDKEKMEFLRNLDTAAWQKGVRILFVPTFYASGTVPY